MENPTETPVRLTLHPGKRSYEDDLVSASVGPAKRPRTPEVSNLGESDDAATHVTSDPYWSTATQLAPLLDVPLDHSVAYPPSFAYGFDQTHLDDQYSSLGFGSGAQWPQQSDGDQLMLDPLDDGGVGCQDPHQPTLPQFPDTIWDAWPQSTFGLEDYSMQANETNGLYPGIQPVEAVGEVDLKFWDHHDIGRYHNDDTCITEGTLMENDVGVLRTASQNTTEEVSVGSGTNTNAPYDTCFGLVSK